MRPVVLDRYRDNRPRMLPDLTKRRAGATDKRERRIKKLEKQSKKLKKLTSTFGKHGNEAYRLIQLGEVDQAIVVFQRQMLATLMRLIPLAEKEYKKYRKEHTAYALNSLVSQARELSSDITASNDRAKLAKTLVMEVIMPAFQQCVQEMVNSHYALKGNLKSYTKDVERMETAVDTCAKDTARFMNEVFRTTAERIKELLTK